MKTGEQSQSKLLKLRTIGQGFINEVIGNGQETNFWCDRWHPIGPLYLHFNLSKSDPAAKCFCDGAWKWPSGGKSNVEVRRLRQLTSCQPALNPKERDVAVWAPCNSGVYNVKSALQILRLASPEVPRYMLVLGQGINP